MNKAFYGTASITNSKRTEVINVDCSPGPATYDPEPEDQEKIPLWTLKPKIEREGCFFNNNKTPGVGAYNMPITLNVCKKNSGKQNRGHKEKLYIDKTTHMSQLNLPTSISNSMGYKFGFRDEVIVRERSPGPIYNVDTVVDQSRLNKRDDSRIMGFGKRSQISGDQKTFPGPGSYSPEKVLPKGYQYCFPKNQKEQRSTHLNPLGPGDYDPQLKSSGRSCNLKGRYQEEKKDQFNTGPGSYEIPDTKSKIGTKFSNNSKNSGIFVKSESPSPFSYTPISSTFRKSGFSLGKKIPFQQKNHNEPGPGSYELRTDINDSGPGGYMGRKKQPKKIDKDSNFSKYNPKMDFVKYDYPKYTFMKNELLEKDQKVKKLGPGSYNNAKKGSSQSFTIPKDQRFKPLVKEKPISTKVNENAYSTIGFMPGYLQREKKSKAQQKGHKQSVQ